MEPETKNGEKKDGEKSPYEIQNNVGEPYRSVKDSVFKWLFSDPDTLLQLYQTLHPEDTETTAADLDLVTLETVIVKDIHNDLGFAVGSKLFILAEAQSTWSVNIILRSLFYLMRTYQNYLRQTRQSMYSTKRVSLPRAELYVIYTGASTIEKTEISLAEESFPGEVSAVDAKVKVLAEGDGNDIINQYIIFSKILDEQIRLHGRTAHAVEETIRICKDRNILKDFLQAHEKETVDIMVQLYSQEEAVSEWGKSQYAEGQARGEAIGEARGVEIGQARGEAIGEARGVEIGQARGEAIGEARGEARGETRGETQKARETSVKLFARGWNIREIADLVGYNIRTVGEWVDGQ